MRPIPGRWRGPLHPKRGQKYHTVNSLRGVKRAGRRRPKWRRSIDLDLHVTSDGVPICTHWKRPMVHDGFRWPKGRNRARGKFRPVFRRPWRQVKRWRTPSGSKIWRMAYLMRWAARLGVRVELEAKPSPQLRRPGPWRKLQRARERTGVDCQVKVLSTNPYAGAILRQAKRHGFTTIILPRGPIPRDWAPYIDRRRGRVHWKD